jgi:uncharacterized tellurite resistance protein B-like protein
MSTADTPHKRGKLTPALALLVSLAYMANADGEVSSEEEDELTEALQRRGHLGGISYEDLVEQGSVYFQNTTLEQFLAEANTILSREQKLSILTSLADTSLADGEVSDAEDSMFAAFLRGLGISETEVEPYLLAPDNKLDYHFSLFD